MLGLAELGQLDSMTLEIFSNLDDSVHLSVRVTVSN